MTSRHRILASIRGDKTDRVANVPLIKQFCTRQLGIPYLEYNRHHRVLVDAQVKIYQRYPFDCFNVMGFAYREASDCGMRLTWLEDTVPHPEDVLVKDRRDISNIRWPLPWEGPLMRDRLKAIGVFKRCCPDVAVLGAVEAPFAQAVTFRGMQQAMIDLIEGEDLLRELMDFILPNEVAFAKAQIEAGADMIHVGDSAASLVGRRHYARLIVSYERELIREVQRMGCPAKLHICGDINHLLDDVATAEASIVDIDWMVDLKKARRQLGPGVCLCGNFDPVKILLQSDPDHVREECRRCIREAGRPFLLSPGCEVPPDTPTANFAALCETYDWES